MRRSFHSLPVVIIRTFVMQMNCAFFTYINDVTVTVFASLLHSRYKRVDFIKLHYSFKSLWHTSSLRTLFARDVLKFFRPWSVIYLINQSTSCLYTPFSANSRPLNTKRFIRSYISWKKYHSKVVIDLPSSARLFFYSFWMCSWRVFKSIYS